MNINSTRLLKRLNELGDIGRNQQGELSRIAFTDADKLGRDKLVEWMQQVNLTVKIDHIGNIHGIWEPNSAHGKKPIMMGSHIDTVVNAGKYDGNYGVLAGLEVIMTLQESGYQPEKGIVISAFSNEEGARFAPDMMGSLVYCAGYCLNKALQTIDSEGVSIGSELQRIGYAGDVQPGFIQPEAYIELHIEQGPVLESCDIPIGIVENLQGISWQRITIEGVANHAGTTPMSMRSDAGLAAAKITAYISDFVVENDNHGVATIGTLQLTPNIINVIAAKAVFTVDLRSPNERNLQASEAYLSQCLKQIENTGLFKVSSEKLARFQPVNFDETLAKQLEKAANKRALNTMRMTSGAGHDAQMMARICPSVMIFVPSKDGISHNPKEHTDAQQLIDGANLLLDTVAELSN